MAWPSPALDYPHPQGGACVQGWGWPWCPRCPAPAWGTGTGCQILPCYPGAPHGLGSCWLLLHAAASFQSQLTSDWVFFIKCKCNLVFLFSEKVNIKLIWGCSFMAYMQRYFPVGRKNSLFWRSGPSLSLHISITCISGSFQNSLSVHPHADIPAHLVPPCTFHFSALEFMLRFSLIYAVHKVWAFNGPGASWSETQWAAADSGETAGVIDSSDLRLIIWEATHAC